MKRLVLSLLMIAGIISFSIYNTVTLYNIKNELTGVLAEMADTVEREGAPAAVEQAERFAALWLEREETLMQFIRHNDLEPITWNSARLPHLAKYGDTAELMAEINSIYLQVNHLWETQTPRARTVL